MMPGSLWSRSGRAILGIQVGAMAVIVGLWCERRVGMDYFRVVSTSMEPSLHPGELIVVNRWAAMRTRFDRRGTSRRELAGQVVTLAASRLGNETLVKRVAAQGGDTIFLRRGTLFVNGVARDHACPTPYRDTATVTDELGDWQRSVQLADTRFGPIPRQSTNRDWGPLLVPDGYLFVLGDNRDHSRDSRGFGFVAESEIVGDVVGVVRNGRIARVCSK